MTNSRHLAVLTKTVNYLQEIYPKGETKNNLAATLQEAQSAVWRVLKQLETTGMVNIDKQRSPWMYFWKKGAVPIITPVFQLVEDPLKEISTVHTAFNDWVKNVKEHSIPKRNLPGMITMAALASLDSRDAEDIAARNEWYANVLEQLRSWYLAYRIIQTIQSIQDKPRLAQMQALNYINKETGLDVREFFQIERVHYLSHLKEMSELA